ncbi:hypothetical protein HOK68_02920 [Candidatus Woesearchaeota archaeon]|jgi:hypothetical protein|nr:hypothetical protein [Candidatus Woesearchaeota archaeon]MBT4387859.1 hypothetical protein [Candidatus Woesearchaeota archaeon]MBT4595678.1 hypothetical protein [Candidatus Woesearchaeota archaeon]MBT5740703.1 hypothetical protein [Candidatus Woesearchaeota archaeon]MBT6505705.1 hypothetical protein [Candidatus Woesearchaeota archaeon]
MIELDYASRVKLLIDLKKKPGFRFPGVGSEPIYEGRIVLTDSSTKHGQLELHYTGTLECENAMGEDFNEPYVFPKKEPHSNSKGKEFGFSTSDLLALKRIHERERASRFGLRDSSPFIEKQDSPFENERPSDRFSKKLFSFIDQQDSKLDEGSKSDYLSSLRDRYFPRITHFEGELLGDRFPSRRPFSLMDQHGSKFEEGSKPDYLFSLRENDCLKPTKFEEEFNIRNNRSFDPFTSELLPERRVSSELLEIKKYLEDYDYKPNPFSDLSFDNPFVFPKKEKPKRSYTLILHVEEEF